MQIEMLVHLRRHAVGPRKIGLVHDHDVGHFQESGFFPLQFIARFRLQQDHQHIALLADGGVSLPCPDRFENDRVKPEGPEQAHHHVEILGDRLLSAGSRQTANEHARIVGRLGDPQSVTQQSAASQRTFGIAAQDSHGAVPRPQQLDRPADQAALADAAAARECRDSTFAWPRVQLMPQDIQRLSARRDRQQTGQRAAVFLTEAADQVLDRLGFLGLMKPLDDFRDRSARTGDRTHA